MTIDQAIDFLIRKGVDLNNYSDGDIEQVAVSMSLLEKNNINPHDYSIEDFQSLANSMANNENRPGGIRKLSDEVVRKEKQELGTRLAAIRMAFDNHQLIFDLESLTRFETAVRSYADQQGFSLDFADFDLEAFFDQIRSSIND